MKKYEPSEWSDAFPELLKCRASTKTDRGYECLLHIPHAYPPRRYPYVLFGWEEGVVPLCATLMQWDAHTSEFRQNVCRTYLQAYMHLFCRHIARPLDRELTNVLVRTNGTVVLTGLCDVYADTSSATSSSVSRHRPVVLSETEAQTDKLLEKWLGDLLHKCTPTR